MILHRLKENTGLVFVLPLLFAAGFLVLSLIPALVSAYALMVMLVSMALIIIAFDAFLAGIYGFVWLISSDNPDRSKHL